MASITWYGFAAHLPVIRTLRLDFRYGWGGKFTGQPVTYQIPANRHETKAVKPGFPREGWKSKKPIIADIYG